MELLVFFFLIFCFLIICVDVWKKDLKTLYGDSEDDSDSSESEGK